MEVKMIDSRIVEGVDFLLDAGTSTLYKNQPLAQDWARVAKIIEETGEAIQELILFTRQNPRKPQDDKARSRMLDELADTAMTAVYAIQHFTKDAHKTSDIMQAAQAKHISAFRNE